MHIYIYIYIYIYICFCPWLYKSWSSEASICWDGLRFPRIPMLNLRGWSLALSLCAASFCFFLAFYTNVSTLASTVREQTRIHNRRGWQKVGWQKSDPLHSSTSKTPSRRLVECSYVVLCYFSCCKTREDSRQAVHLEDPQEDDTPSRRSKPETFRIACQSHFWSFSYRCC